MTEDSPESGVVFEEAIAKTGGYGPYQRNLLLLMLPFAFTFVFGVSTMSYIMPAVVCEFKITKYYQGLLYSAIYAGVLSAVAIMVVNMTTVGMVPFGALWGVAADIFGRRKILIVTTTIVCIFELLSAFSINYWMLFLSKFFAGCAASGVHLTYYIYLSEFVDAKFKDAMTIRTGGFAAAGYVIQPLVAAFLIPLKFRYTIIEDYVYINSWKVFLLLCSLAPLLGIFVGVFLLTETPKYLLIQKRNDESLQILKDIYASNVKSPRDSLFPVNNVVLEPHDRKHRQESIDDPNVNSVTRIINYVKPLFQYPYFRPALMSFAAQFITMGAYNTIRQHIPTLYAVALGYGQKKGNLTAYYTKPEEVPFCVLFEGRQDLFSSSVECNEYEINLNSEIYLWSTFAGFMVFVAFFLVRYLVQIFGKVTVFLTAHVISAIAISYFPFTGATFAVLMTTIYSMCMQNCLTIALGLMIGRVPVTMRGLTVSLIMVVGRIGVILGNQLLPVISTISCYAGFWSIAFINLLSIPIMFIYSIQPNPYEDAALESAAKTN